MTTTTQTLPFYEIVRKYGADFAGKAYSYHDEDAPVPVARDVAITIVTAKLEELMSRGVLNPEAVEVCQKLRLAYASPSPLHEPQNLERITFIQSLADMVIHQENHVLLYPSNFFLLLSLVEEFDLQSISRATLINMGVILNDMLSRFADSIIYDLIMEHKRTERAQQHH